MLLRKNDSYNGILKECLQQKQIVILEKLATSFFVSLQSPQRQADYMVEVSIYLGHLRDTKRTWTKKDTLEMRRVLSASFQSVQEENVTSSNGLKFHELVSNVSKFSNGTEKALEKLTCDFLGACREHRKDLEDRIALAHLLHERVAAPDIDGMVQAAMKSTRSKPPVLDSTEVMAMVTQTAQANMRCDFHLKIMRSAHEIYRKSVAGGENRLAELSVLYHEIDFALAADSMKDNSMADHFEEFKKTFSIKSLAVPEYNSLLVQMKDLIL